MSEPRSVASLDPVSWRDLRRDGHRMLDDMFDHLQTLRDQPVWQQPTSQMLAAIDEPLPRVPAALSDIRLQFVDAILPGSSGNAPPGFMGWVQDGGTPVGMLAEMLAAGMNANLGGRHHMAIEVEHQVVSWTRIFSSFHLLRAVYSSRAPQPPISWAYLSHACAH